MAEIVAALDEQGANKLLDTVIGLIPPQTKSGSGNLGPFVANYSVTASLTNGDVDLITPTSSASSICAWIGTCRSAGIDLGISARVLPTAVCITLVGVSARRAVDPEATTPCRCRSATSGVAIPRSTSAWRGGFRAT